MTLLYTGAGFGKKTPITTLRQGATVQQGRPFIHSPAHAKKLFQAGQPAK
jgi:hypothetical protein